MYFLFWEIYCDVKTGLSVNMLQRMLLLLYQIAYPWFHVFKMLYLDSQLSGSNRSRSGRSVGQALACWSNDSKMGPGGRHLFNLKQFHCTHFFITLPSSWNYWNTVQKDVKILPSAHPSLHPSIHPSEIVPVWTMGNQFAWMRLPSNPSLGINSVFSIINSEPQR